MTTTAKITRRSTMQEVLEAYPSAQRALFGRYHIGGCNSCGYQPEDILEAVAHGHNITDLDEVVAFIQEADEVDRRIQASPREVAEALRSSAPPRLVDVRTRDEWDVAHIPGATLVSEELTQEMMQWPKDAPIVFYCHHGQRSLDAASYFAGHGFRNVRSITGGIEAWSLEVDSSVPRYEVAGDPYSGAQPLRPLRLVVSQAAGCQKPVSTE
jgi:rhodanese-related sulfurtransferase